MRDMRHGGPAFPMREERHEPITADITAVTPGEWPGMSLRDYFAAKAMQAMVSTVPVEGQEIQCNPIAEDAYKMADAMLRARLPQHETSTKE